MSTESYRSGVRVVRDQCLAEATRLMLRHFPTLSDQALIEYYPTFHRPWDGQPSSHFPGIFAFQFFDRAGLNPGYYLPDLHSLHILAKPREWHLPKECFYDLSHIIQLLPTS
jgi:hypothetical protein